jgi:hypothetical protein
LVFEEPKAARHSRSWRRTATRGVRLHLRGRDLVGPLGGRCGSFIGTGRTLCSWADLLADWFDFLARTVATTARGNRY